MSKSDVEQNVLTSIHLRASVQASLYTLHVTWLAPNILSAALQCLQITSQVTETLPKM
jgi:hypothetical protein